MVYKYGWDDSSNDADVTARFKMAMVANANRGGENVGPGALIGALLGAAAGYSRLPTELVEGLARSSRPSLDEHIEAFVAAAPFAGNSSEQKSCSS